MGRARRDSRVYSVLFCTQFVDWRYTERGGGKEARVGTNSQELRFGG